MSVVDPLLDVGSVVAVVSVIVVVEVVEGDEADDEEASVPESVSVSVSAPAGSNPQAAVAISVIAPKQSRGDTIIDMGGS